MQSLAKSMELQSLPIQQPGASAVGNQKERLFPTLVSALIVCISSVLMGYTYGFSSSAQLDLTEGLQNLPKDYRFSTILSEAFVAFCYIGAMFGSLFVGVIADHWGRRTSLVLSAVPYFTGYIMISYGHYLPTAISFKCILLVGRFLTGIGVGFSYSLCPIYIAEISSAKYRGVFGSFVEIGVTCGILLNYSIGSIPGFPYFNNSLVAAGISVAFLLMMVWLKETPRWLVSKGHKNEACQVLIWLRGPTIDITEEIMDIELSENISLWKSWQKLTGKSVAAPTVIVVVVVILQEAVGIGVIVAYAADIFKNVGMNNPKITAAYAVGGTMFFTSYLCIFTIEYFGRKLLLIISGLGMMIGTFSLGIFFYITRPSICSSNSTLVYVSELQQAANNFHCNSQYAPLAVTSVIIYLIGFSIGWGPVPYTLLAELLPFRVRGLTGGFASFFNLATAAIFSFFFINYYHFVHLWFAWWSFTVINGGAILFVIIFIRETKGKTLEDIEKYYQKNLF